MRAVDALRLFVLVLGPFVVGGCSSDASGDDQSVDGEDALVGAQSTLQFRLIASELDPTTQDPLANQKWSDVDLQSLTPALEAKGLPGFPKTMTIGREDGPKFKAFLDQLASLKTELGRTFDFPAAVYPDRYQGLCYTGRVSSVIVTIEKLRGSMFDQDMGILGYRYGTKKVVGDPESTWLDPREVDNEQDVATWKTFDPKSNAFLMMADAGQNGDGSELFAVLIPKCP